MWISGVMLHGTRCTFTSTLTEYSEQCIELEPARDKFSLDVTLSGFREIISI